MPAIQPGPPRHSIPWGLCDPECPHVPTVGNGRVGGRGLGVFSHLDRWLQNKTQKTCSGLVGWGGGGSSSAASAPPQGPCEGLSGGSPCPGAGDRHSGRDVPARRQDLGPPVLGAVSIQVSRELVLSGDSPPSAPGPCFLCGVTCSNVRVVSLRRVFTIKKCLCLPEFFFSNAVCLLQVSSPLGAGASVRGRPRLPSGHPAHFPQRPRGQAFLGLEGGRPQQGAGATPSLVLGWGEQGL